MAEINLSPYTAEYEAIQRRRKMAEALQAQSAEPLPTNQTAGGYVVPVSPYAGLAKMLQAGLGAYGQHRADTEAKKLVTQREEASKSDMSALIGALQNTEKGTPAIKEPWQGNTNLDQFEPTPAKPATGVLSPDFLNTLKTPEARSSALALATQLMAPKGVHVVNEGGSLIKDTGEVLFRGQQKSKWGTTPRYEMIDGVQHAVLYNENGEKKDLGPAAVQNQFNSPSIDASRRLNMDMFKFLNLSKEQEKQLEIALQNANAATTRATNQGIQTQFETGTGVMPPGVTAPVQPSAPAQPGVPPVSAPQTGTTLDLNNPGGLRPVGATKDFQRFKTPEDGINAIVQNLKAYGDKGINTVEKIVSTWAPSNENNTKAYIDHVSRMLGVPPGQQLDMKNPYVLQALTTAIMTKEQGPRLFAASSTGAPTANPTGNNPTNKPVIDSIPPKDAKVLMMKKPEETIRAKTILQDTDRLISMSDELRGHPGLNNIVGKFNQFPILDFNDDTLAARRLQDSMVKQVAVRVLTNMRQASKTGGAVGNVTEKEWPILEQNIAALDSAQSTKDYQTAIDNLKSQLQSMKTNVTNSYEQTYGGKLDYVAPKYFRQNYGPSSSETINSSDRALIDRYLKKK
jgi:hypothetical protein